MPETDRGGALTVAAVLFALLAVSNLLKPLQLGGAQTGFVFFGARLSGPANTIAGPLFAVVLAAYAVGIWQMRPWALPLGIAYALYVTANLVLFPMRTPQPPDVAAGYRMFVVVYAVVALGVSWGTVYLLKQRLAR
jgi:hypothetical protein